MIQNMRFYIRVNKQRFCFFMIKILVLDDFTEDVYFMHEELLQELEAQYEVNKSMYEQIEIWNELFLEFQEFEVSSSFAFSFFLETIFFRKMQVILNDFIVVVIVHLLKRKLVKN
jgi:hypothetical protein